MAQEIDADRAAGTLYASPRLSTGGQVDYPDLLAAAASRGTDVSLAAELGSSGRLNTEETAVRNGKSFTKRVPINAAATLAEGEFNRYYARAVCLRALDEGLSEVRVYRAKNVASPRSQSEAMIGRLIDAGALLDDLRKSIGVEPALGLPPGPNSGLSVELPA